MTAPRSQPPETSRATFGGASFAVPRISARCLPRARCPGSATTSPGPPSPPSSSASPTRSSLSAASFAISYLPSADLRSAARRPGRALPAPQSDGRLRRRPRRADLARRHPAPAGSGDLVLLFATRVAQPAVRRVPVGAAPAHPRQATATWSGLSHERHDGQRRHDLRLRRRGALAAVPPACGAARRRGHLPRSPARSSRTWIQTADRSSPGRQRRRLLSARPSTDSGSCFARPVLRAIAAAGVLRRDVRRRPRGPGRGLGGRVESPGSATAASLRPSS